MLIDFKILNNYNIVPRGVLHVGMHKAEEYSIYKNAGVESICFVEANPFLCDYVAEQVLKNINNTHIVHAAISDRIGEEIELKITNNNESSSILDLKDHSIIYPHIVETHRLKLRTNTLDQIIQIYEDPKIFNILNLDIQGAELKALKGFTHWSNVDAIFTEVNYREMYSGCALIGEITSFLKCFGFMKVEEVDTGCGWGDALYIRK